MSQWTDRHTSNLTLQINAVIKQVRDTQPALADAFEKRIQHDLIAPTCAVINKYDAIRTSGRYSPGGELDERRLLAHAFTTDTLGRFTAATVTKLQAQREAQRQALHTRKSPPSDPALALVHELRAQEWRRKLEALPQLDLQVLLRQTTNVDLLDVLEGAPAGFPIAESSLINEARDRIAEANHPELGQLAALEASYSFAIGVAKQTVIQASGLTELEVNTPPGPAPQPVAR
jgi:hypothetical protein